MTDPYEDIVVAVGRVRSRRGGLLEEADRSDLDAILQCAAELLAVAQAAQEPGCPDCEGAPDSEHVPGQPCPYLEPLRGEPPTGHEAAGGV